MIIGISGKMGTGKTTLADLLIAKLGEGVRLSFATAVREEIREFFGIPLTMMQGDARNRRIVVGVKMMTIRELMQMWGTEVRRAGDPQYWVCRLDRQVREARARLVVIDDVRFLSEAYYIQSSLRDLKVAPYPCYAGENWLFRLEPYLGYGIHHPGEHWHPSETELDLANPDDCFNGVFAPEFGKLAELADDIISRYRLAELLSEEKSSTA